MQLDQRFLDSTRGRVVALLRRGAQTVEELAQALALTDNAVRNHLAILERDGLVRAQGVRREPRAGKPAYLYELRPEAHALFSRAYQPALGAVAALLFEKLPPDAAEPLLREVGVRLAHDAGGRAGGDADARVQSAAAVLTALGAELELLADDEGTCIRGAACPLAAIVRAHPEVCVAVEALVGEIAGAPTRRCCEHGEHPRCRFVVLRDDG